MFTKEGLVEIGEKLSQDLLACHEENRRLREALQGLVDLALEADDLTAEQIKLRLVALKELIG